MEISWRARRSPGAWLLLDRDLEPFLPLAFDFLGVPDPQRPAPAMDPAVRQRQLFTFTRRLVQARSTREPAVLFFDDTHWVDEGSDAFIAQVADIVPGTRTTLLLNFRPEYSAEWMARPFYQQLPLHPLGTEAVDELLADLLGADPSLVRLPALMTRRTPNRSLAPADRLEIHPDDALREGIEEGAEVVLQSRWGCTRAPARLTTRVAPGTLVLSFQFPECHTNRLTGPHVDPDSKCPEYKVTAVRIEPAEDSRR